MEVEKCKTCEKCQVIRKDRFGIYLGCYENPYKGKWVAEIEECPKNKSQKP